MKKRILSCLMALALCLTLLPTAALAEEPEGTAQTSPAVEEAADPANGKAKQENQPADQEEQQEDSATKQDGAVAAVQAMIDALPDAAELDGMDDEDAMAVYEAFQTACDAYYDTLTEEQQAQLKNTEKLAALSERFSQLETLATSEHQDHCVCGKSGCTATGHNEITFNKWLTSTGYKLEVGEGDHTYGTGQTPEGDKYVLPADKLSADNYYLRANITIDHPIQIKGNVTICLNGHTIESKAEDKPVFEIVTGGTLTLTDCGSAGKVTRASGVTGCGVYVNGGKFNLYGGSITGNTATKGGGVYVSSGEFNMYGGSITGNTAAKGGTGNGGGVYVGGGTFTMSGNASITGNTASDGGGVCLSSSYSTFNMTGGTISKNEATSQGGGVSMVGKFTMSGGSITKNKAGSFGGGVKVTGGTFTVSGGTITNNKTAKDGGGVYMGGGTFTVSGTAKVTDNTKDGAQNNVCLLKVGDIDKTITIGGALTGKIGVTTESKPSGNPIDIATAGSGYTITDADKDKFFSDDKTYVVKHEGGKLVLAEAEAQPNPPTEHTHCLCGETHTIIGDHKTDTQITFTKWEREDSLPDSTGNWYLTKDVTLSSTWKPANGTVLCLNGKTITGPDNDSEEGYVIRIDNQNVTFTLCDCKGGTNNDGKITHAQGTKGGGVSVPVGTFYLYGGSITGNTRSDGTGGVYVGLDNPTFNMYGGSITGNTGSYCGGVFLAPNATFNMSGGTIRQNTANTSSVTEKISGGVLVFGSKTAFTMSGGSITGNEATRDSGGVYVYDGTFTVSGSATVTGNTADGKTNNVYLSDKKIITIGKGGLSGKIGVTTETKPATGKPVTVIAATKGITGLTKYVVSDDTAYETAVEGSAIVLKVVGDGGTTPAEHTHNYGDWSKDGTNHWHECTDAACPDKPGSIKDKEAHIYTDDADTICNVCGYVRTVTPSNPGGDSTGGTTGGGSSSSGSSSGGGGGSSTGSSSGGGGGSSSPSNHPVKAEVSKDPDGSVSLSKTSAAKGDKVTITVKPERYYEVDEVIVRDSKGKQLAVKDNGDGTFTFEMPADKVTVEPSFSWVNPFADVANNAYYVDAVEWMLKREVTQGTTETTFSPDLNCTRAQIVTFLWRVAGSPAPKGTVSFADVSADSYYAKAVAWATENGITDGIGGGLFSPDATCTRAQSAVFLYRVAGSPAVNGSAGFSDVAADAYYAQAVAWAKEHGITNGIGGGLFGSANDCTRAQIAAFLYRYMK